MAKPPSQNASNWSTGRGRETMRTVIPIRSGSAIAANAITSTAPHTTGTLPGCRRSRPAAATGHSWSLLEDLPGMRGRWFVTASG